MAKNKKYVGEMKGHKGKTKKIWFYGLEYFAVPLKFFITKKKDQYGKKIMAEESAKRTMGGYYKAPEKEK